MIHVQSSILWTVDCVCERVCWTESATPPQPFNSINFKYVLDYTHPQTYWGYLLCIFITIMATRGNKSWLKFSVSPLCLSLMPVCAFEPTCVWRVLKKPFTHSIANAQQTYKYGKIENMFAECSNISMREHRRRLNAVSSIKYILFVVMIYGIIISRISSISSSIHICLVQWWWWSGLSIA